MKLVVVRYDDAIDISSIQAGQAGAVNTIVGGTVVFAAPVYEPPPEVVPHNHPASTNVGTSQPV